MNTTATAPRTALQMIPVGHVDGTSESFIVMALTDTELAGLTDVADDLSLPYDRNGFNRLKAWHVFDTTGAHIGRVISRGSVMTAEWYDGLEQQDWILAEWACRRLERAVYQITLIRDEVTRRVRAQAAAVRRADQAASYLRYLETEGLGLDEDGDEVPARYGVQSPMDHLRAMAAARPVANDRRRAHARPRLSGRDRLSAMCHEMATGRAHPDL